MDKLVEMAGIHKTFGTTTVLRDVKFALERGSVHALMGENGAGKSTLMKILSGVIHPNAGEVRVRGQAVHFKSPKEARRAGVSTVFQEFALIPNLTVSENMFLGHEPRRADGSIDQAAVMGRSREILASVFPNLDPKAIVGNLSVAQQQAVEIAKGLTSNADIFIFDEPTAALNSADVEHLFSVIRELKAQGKGIIYISHRMNEIFALSDTVTVMKDGAWMKTAPTRDFALQTLVSTMVGRELHGFYPPRSASIGEPLLKVKDIRLKDNAPHVALELHRGEIVGLAGLEGQGQREIMRAIVGLDPVRGAAVARQSEGKSVQINVEKGFLEAIKAGVGFIPEDRKLEGLFLSLPVTDNIALGKQLNKPLFRKAWNKVAEVRKKSEQLRIAAADPNAAIGRLSGGNQQKVLLARWLLSGADILIIEEPTRGVDVGAKSDIYRLLREFADNGGTVLVSSRELVELIGLCDNILVVQDREIVASLPAEGATEESVLGEAFRASTAQH